MRRLLTIEGVFEIEGRGVILAPNLPVFTTGSVREQAELRAPNGATAGCDLVVCFERFSLTPEGVREGRRSSSNSCMLRGVTVNQVPVGAELWCRDDLVEQARKSFRCR